MAALRAAAAIELRVTAGGSFDLEQVRGLGIYS
jgi:hypothetical protein